MNDRNPELRSGGKVVKVPESAAPWILILSGILFFAGPLFSDRNFYFRDILDFHYPLRRILIDTWAHGAFPLWNPNIYFGQPMLANPNYMALYPTNLFHLIFSFDYAFKLHFIVHPLLAGLGLYFLLKRLQIRTWPALFGAMAYQFSGTLLSFLNLYNILPAVALMPWIAWAFVGAMDGKWLRRSLAFGGLLALQIVALEPLMLQCIALLVAGLAVARLLESDDRAGEAKRIGRILLCGIPFALGLAAIQVFPTIEMLSRAVRGSGIAHAAVSRWSMHPMDFLQIVVPNLFGNPFAIGYATSWGEAYHHGDIGIIVSFFAGTGTVLLAFISLVSPRTRLQKALICTALAGIFLALGRFNPVFRLLSENVPGFGLGRYPAKYFLLVNLIIAGLAALGLEALLAKGDPRSKLRGIAVVGFLGIALGTVVIAMSTHWTIKPEILVHWLRSQVDPQQIAAKDFGVLQRQLVRSLFTSGAFFVLSGSLILFSRFWNDRRITGGLWFVLLLGELIPPGLTLAPLISGANIDFVPDVERFILASQQGEPSRVVGPKWLPPVPNRLRAPNRSLAWATLYNRMASQTLGGMWRGIQYSLDGSVDLLNTRESEEMYRRCLLLPEVERVQFMEKLDSALVLSIGEVRHPDLRKIASFDTMSDYRLYVYRLARSLPRAYLASTVLSVPTHDAALDLLLRPDISLGNAVILEGEGSPGGTGGMPPGVLRVTDYRNQFVRIEAESSVAGYLVLLDSYYPGWRAFVDGRRVEILRANYAFRAVALPAGKHTVEFAYNPRPFFAGLGIGLLTAALGICLSVVKA